MNEVLKVIAERHSCRAYDGMPVEKEKLDAIALAALQAPSAMNKQPWRLVVITDKSIIDELDDEGMRMLAEQEDKSFHQRFMDRGGKLFYNAPCMFLILQTAGGELDCGIVSQNIALAASSLGLGNVICGMARLPFSGAKAEYFKSKIGFPEGYDFAMSVLVGNGTMTKAPHEPDMSKLRFL